MEWAACGGPRSANEVGGPPLGRTTFVIEIGGSGGGNHGGGLGVGAEAATNDAHGAGGKDGLRPRM